jgi:hypothetical protein
VVLLLVDWHAPRWWGGPPPGPGGWTAMFRVADRPERNFEGDAAGACPLRPKRRHPWLA